jgi:outer membrane receptor protein involved in Fe transport
MLSNTTSTSPTNLWVPSSTIVEPQIADQVALGYFRNFRENKYETSVEVYYKNLQNQIEYKNGADPFLNPIIESELYFGKGWSYGIELFIKKKYGKLYGWLGYTLSGTNRKFDDIDDSKVFPARYDRTHDVSFVLSYDLNKKWKLSTVWVFATGNAVTFPVGKYEYDGKIFSLYTERNQYRMPAYHRLDLSATYQGKKRKKFQSSWNFSIYNVYARKNAYMISFRQSEDNPEITEAVKLSLFTIIPSVAYNFKF